MGRLPGGLVAPEHFARIVVGVAVKPRRGVIGMRGHDDELIHDVVDSLLVLAPGEVPHGILGVERLGHVQPVEPHLVRVDLLVPESPVGVAGLRLQLGVERVERHLIAHVSRAVVQFEKGASGTDVVEVVFRLPISQHLSAGTHDRVEITLGIGRELLNAVHPAGIGDGEQFETRGVVPLHLPGGNAVEVRRRRVAEDFARGHADGGRVSGFVQCAGRGAGGGQRAQCGRNQTFFHAILVSWSCFRLCVLRYSAGDMWNCSRKQRLK